MNTNDMEKNTHTESNSEFIQELISNKLNKNYSYEKKYNRKLYPIYKMFSWDLLFYYSIIFLFLTIEKGLSASQVLLVDSFYPLFKLIANFPCLTLADKIGRRKSLIIGNLFVTVSIFIIIIASRLRHLILADFIMAIGYSLKNLCESSLLHECIENKKEANNQFSKISGKGSAFHYIFDAVSTISTGFLFVYNSYLPLFICLIICIITVVISYMFEEYTNPIEKKRKLNERELSTSDYITELVASFKFIFYSKRLRALLIFTGLFSGLLQIRSSIASSLLLDINLPEQYFGIVFAALQLVACISSLRQNYYHKKYKNKLLTHLSLKYTFAMIFLGIVITLKIPFIPTLVLVVILHIFQYSAKGPYFILIQRYLNSFSTPELSTKIYTVSSILEALCGTLISFSASFLLSKTTTAYTSLIIGLAMFVLFIFVLDYMKSRLGLAPEEYDKKDIEYISPNKLYIDERKD